MKVKRPTRRRQSETGIALLIAIFILLLIGVVAISLIVSSGTESALAGNYRSSTSVYYAALAGLEEARARLSPNDPNSFAPGFLPAPVGVCAPVYVRNPLGGENITPWDPSNVYYDSEFGQELGAICGATPPSPSPITSSVWNNPPLNSLPFAGPLYKWVRINGVTEQSLNLDVCPYDGLGASLIFYGVATPTCNPALGLNDQGAGVQVLEITALAVLPNGSQKLLQYLTPAPLTLNFPAALTLDGANIQPNTQFVVPNTGNFLIRGDDQFTVGNCNPGGPVAAVGYTDPSDANIVNAIQSAPPGQDRRGNYTNGVAPIPDVVQVALPANMPDLNSLVQLITKNADAVLTGPITQSDSHNVMPLGMSSTNPKTVVVNGDLTLSGWHGQGYGLLLVTGQLKYDPDASWNGIVLVTGLGKMTSNQSGNGRFNGAVFLASTNPAVPPMFDFNPTSGTNGIYYSSCWVQASLPPLKILSFHEISQ